MLRVSARTVSRRLVVALSQLEEQARNVGVWLAAFALVALGVVSRPGATYWRVTGALRSDRWTLVAAVGTATVVTAASIVAVATSPVSPVTGASTFSPAARSINAPLPMTLVTTGNMPSSSVTVVPPAIEDAGPAHKAKPTHDPLAQTAPTAAWPTPPATSSATPTRPPAR